MTHGPDCDGYRMTHWPVVRYANGMWQATCLYVDGVEQDEPHWRGSLVGPGAKSLAHREASEHAEEVPCDGRCLPPR